MRHVILRLTALALLAAVLATPVATAKAQSSSDLPALAALTSVRFDYVSTFNGEPGIVCQEEWASASRYHSTCRELVNADYPEIDINLVAGRVTEFVYYDGMGYFRTGDERTWASAVDPEYDPSLTLNQILFAGYIAPENTAITTIGQSSVGGTSATQYQFWSLDPDLNAASGGQYVYDVFVSAQGFVLKDQVSQRGSFPMGNGELALIWTYKDFNGPIAVSPPPSESVRAASSAAMRVSPGALLRVGK